MENGCFVCSKTNPYGLKLSFFFEDDKLKAKFNLDNVYQGYNGIVHGGIQSAILDDAMANIYYLKGITSFTMKICVEFLKPCYVLTDYVVEAYETQSKGSRIKEAEAYIKDLNGNIISKAKATFMLKISKHERV